MVTTSGGGGAPSAPPSSSSAAAAAAGGGGSGGGTTGGTKAPRRSSGNKSHSRSYPRGVGLDFRKLAGLTLLSYIDHHGAYSACTCVFRVVSFMRKQRQLQRP
jgi:hypothetical protein